jgi:hypothetical protein
MKTDELDGIALDWAVAKCEGIEEKNWYWNDDRLCFSDQWEIDFEPTINWVQGGAIIERERISLWCDGTGDWEAKQYGKNEMWASTPLVAAMRCYVASKLGDEVEIPTELF